MQYLPLFSLPEPNKLSEEIETGKKKDTLQAKLKDKCRRQRATNAAMRNENVFAGNELAWLANFDTPSPPRCAMLHAANTTRSQSKKRRTWRSAKLSTHADDNEAAAGNGDVVGEQDEAGGRLWLRTSHSSGKKRKQDKNCK